MLLNFGFSELLWSYESTVGNKEEKAKKPMQGSYSAWILDVVFPIKDLGMCYASKEWSFMLSETETKPAMWLVKSFGLP